MGLNIARKNIMQKSELKIDDDGNREWFLNGKLHREEGRINMYGPSILEKVLKLLILLDRIKRNQ